MINPDLGGKTQQWQPWTDQLRLHTARQCDAAAEWQERARQEQFTTGLNSLADVMRKNVASLTATLF